MRQGRRAGLLWGMCALVGAVGACETSRNPGQIVRDQVPPNIQLTTSADTQDIAGGLNFGVTATDNLGLKDIQLTYTGGYIKRSEEHTSELQSHHELVCRLLLEKKNKTPLRLTIRS